MTGSKTEIEREGKVLQRFDSPRVLPDWLQLDSGVDVQEVRRESLNGNYQFGRTLGTGGCAEVFLARHKATGEYVAVKAVDKRSLKRKQEARLRREYAIMKHLNHPNLVKLIEVIENPMEICLVMEYAPAGDLYDYLVRQPNCRLTEKKARLIFGQVAAGLRHLHRSGFVHRDIKPENILLGRNKRVMLGDLGYSTVWDRNTVMDTSCGSLFYASPEIVGQKKYFGPEVDVWSLGVVLYVMVNGRLPFQGSSDDVTRSKILGGKFRVLPHNSHLLKDLLSGMLCADPAKRLSIDDVLAHPWMTARSPKMRSAVRSKQQRPTSPLPLDVPSTATSSSSSPSSSCSTNSSSSDGDESGSSACSSASCEEPILRTEERQATVPAVVVEEARDEGETDKGEAPSRGGEARAAAVSKDAEPQMLAPPSAHKRKSKKEGSVHKRFSVDLSMLFSRASSGSPSSSPKASSARARRRGGSPRKGSCGDAVPPATARKRGMSFSLPKDLKREEDAPKAGDAPPKAKSGHRLSWEILTKKVKHLR